MFSTPSWDLLPSVCVPIGLRIDPAASGEAGFESDLLKGAAGSSRGRRDVGVTARGLRHPLPTDEVAERLIVP